MSSNVAKKQGAKAPMQGKVRMLTMTAMLAAVATVLMFFDFSVPFMPSFIKLDFSELPALIASFSMGPVSGIAVCLIKNLINLTVTTTGGIGELCNFLLGATFVIPAGLIYKFKKNKKMAVIGALIGALVMALCSIPINYFISYPVYENFMPLDVIVGMYQALYSGIDNLLEALIVFNAPFTFFKGLCSVLITMLVYKRISPFIKGKHD